MSSPGAQSSMSSASSSRQGPIQPASPSLPAELTQNAPSETPRSTSSYVESSRPDVPSPGPSKRYPDADEALMIRTPCEVIQRMVSR